MYKFQFTKSVESQEILHALIRYGEWKIVAISIEDGYDWLHLEKTVKENK